MADRVYVWKDAAAEWRWTRHNGENSKIVADSGEGYVNREHAVRMAYEVNGGEFTVMDEDNRVIEQP